MAAAKCYCLATTFPACVHHKSGRRSSRRRAFVFAEGGDAEGGAVKQLLKLGSVSSEKLVIKRKLPLPGLGRLRRAPDPKTVFVAGATGQTGARISQQLLRNGFGVRGGVSDLNYAQQVAEFASQYGVISREEARRLNAVECDFSDAEAIAKAIGNAGKVVVAIGPSEDGPRASVTAKDALQVVEAASLANVGHLVLVCEEGGLSSSSTPFSFSGIAGFFSRLIGGSSEVTLELLLESIVDTSLSFTFLKTLSTEGIDDFSAPGSVVLLSEGTYNIGTEKVSKSQLASVVAKVVDNVSLAENKVIEVASISSAVSKPIEELLSAIPVDGRRAALAEARAKSEAEETERQVREQAEAEARKAMGEAQAASQLASRLEVEAKKLAEEEARAAANAKKAKAKVEEAAAKIKQFGFASLGFKSAAPDLEDEEEKTAGIVGVLSKTFSSSRAALQGRVPTAAATGSKVKLPRDSPQAPKRNVSKSYVEAGKQKKEVKEPARTAKFLGNFSQQEAIYVDD